MKMHNKNLTYVCNICQEKSLTNEDFKKHIKTKHMIKGENKSKQETRNMRTMQRLCISCNIYFESDDILTKHIDKNHVRDIRKYCPKCEIRPNNSNDLRKHLVNDHNEEWRVQKQIYAPKPRWNSNRDQRQGYYIPRNSSYDLEFPGISTSNRFSKLYNQGNVSRGQMY